ncbi:hypothetical protein [Trichlorobacter ammonificans]|uniref:Diheme cytochrome c, NapB-like n=1 Tax=Trichlorobacter ammonificans TaxID=2916410 RepID=A0ABM9D9N1_9BACT|nr:hypothetical protein [Trichlorobacter ammonificans]CAH2031863.1 putative Diheme cytochrome c, NapB-like [Trichlorobacter ammonificans]
MKRMVQLVTTLGMVASLALLAPAFANEQPELNLAKDASEAPGTPMAVPHVMKPGEDGEACNACHRSGVGKTPPTSHPERLNCTQCHVQGEVKKPAKAKKKK